MRKTLRRTLLVIVAVGLPVRLAFLFADGIPWKRPPEPTRDEVAARSASSDGRGSLTLLSRTHTLDRLYQSMQGPFSNHPSLRLAEDGDAELLWLTGVRVELVGDDGCTPVSREFFCHANLTFSPNYVTPRRRDGGTFTPMPDLRLFTLVPGRLDIALPEGFGVPVYADEPLDNYSMSLNLNVTDRAPQVRFKTTVDYVHGDAPAARAIKPLFRRAVYGYEPIGKQSPHVVCSSASHPGAACGTFVGMSASDATVAAITQGNTLHWLIPPGDYESRIPVTEQLALAEDTTAHYVTGHLHPYGRSIRLFDATEDRDVFTIRSADFGDRLGVAKMDEVVSREGVVLRKDHQYQLITTYHNPTDQPIDAMSILYVYALDKQFGRTAEGALAAAATR